MLLSHGVVGLIGRTMVQRLTKVDQALAGGLGEPQDPGAPEDPWEDPWEEPPPPAAAHQDIGAVGPSAHQDIGAIGAAAYGYAYEHRRASDSHADDHADADANQHTNAHQHAHAHADGHTDADADQHAHAHADADAHPHADAHADSDAARSDVHGAEAR